MEKAAILLDQIGILFDRRLIFSYREGDNNYSIFMTIFG